MSGGYLNIPIQRSQGRLMLQTGTTLARSVVASWFPSVTTGRSRAKAVVWIQRLMAITGGRQGVSRLPVADDRAESPSLHTPRRGADTIFSRRPAAFVFGTGGKPMNRTCSSEVTSSCFAIDFLGWLPKR